MQSSRGATKRRFVPASRSIGRQARITSACRRSARRCYPTSVCSPCWRRDNLPTKPGCMMQRVDNPQAGRLMVSTSRLDTAFLEQQKRRLTALRQEILSIRQRQQGEQTSVNTELSGQARDYEDDAQRLAALELQDNLVAHDDERLSNIERALQKIDEGTYGLSVASGKPISVERLKAFPEALYTEEEQRQREQNG